ncbi:MAG: carbamoyltransferase HypF [Erythrobacter sp.]
MRTGLLCAERIRVRGQVQGVGFRPHVWRQAHAAGIRGHVGNDGAGVFIHAWGEQHSLDEFVARLRSEAPPLARIDHVERDRAEGEPPPEFTIVESVSGTVRTQITPDAASCPQCLSEIFDPADRRSAHAFANCTHCGPRLSIVRAVPYDRASTSMAQFPMCPACRSEYDDPADRRFHAQPVACPECGPRLWIEPDMAGDPLDCAARLLCEGRIVAIKGIGGFHLACDATNEAAVARLRRRKARDAKPFALMAPDVEAVEAYCHVEHAARELLESAAAPIVLLPLRQDHGALAGGIAPGQDHVGFMLAYTPLHHLLLSRMGCPLVMTSANHSDEPQVTDNALARERLAGLADAWLMHDRAIVNRVDDSVVSLENGRIQPIRRARGYAPAAIPLPRDFAQAPPILAMGGELKATFCLLHDGQAIPSQHIGDLEDAAALDDYAAMVALYREMFDFVPAIVAVDRHSDYLSTKLGERIADECGARLVRVAHHHAHMAACLADAGVAPIEAADDCYAILLDGLGLGPDGALWGGEILRGGYRSAERVARFTPVALAGGAAAMREPWRNLVAQLQSAFGAGWRDSALPLTVNLPDMETIASIERMIATGTNSPPCSSAGRLFDAVAAALGLHARRQDHEAQAAMALEALARPWLDRAEPYPFELYGAELCDIGWQPMWSALIADLAAGRAAGLVAARFHKGVARALVAALARQGGAGCRVALSGGVFQNRIIAGQIAVGLEAIGCTVLRHRHVPANDGGLSLGQAVLAAMMAGGGR